MYICVYMYIRVYMYVCVCIHRHLHCSVCHKGSGWLYFTIATTIGGHPIDLASSIWGGLNWVLDSLQGFWPYLLVQVCVCVHILCVCVYVYICVCVCVYTYIYIYTYIYVCMTYTHTHTYIYIYIYIHIYIYIYIYIHTYIHTHTHVSRLSCSFPLLFEFPLIPESLLPPPITLQALLVTVTKRVRELKPTDSF
jgi:hypothetical protein